MCTGTATVASLPRNFGRTRNSRISALKKLSGCITTSIIPTMWMPRTPGTTNTTLSATARWKVFSKQQDLPRGKHLPDRHHGKNASTGYPGTHRQRILRASSKRRLWLRYPTFWMGAGIPDEGTPHIHERHVFDCKNRYGELCPQQEKALEELGFELPDPKCQLKGNIIIENKPLMQYAGRCSLTSAASMECIWSRSRPMVGGRIWRSRTTF